MASGPRKEGEGFEEYRERLKIEKKVMKLYSSGRFFHISHVLETGKGERLKKKEVDGTYNKGA